MSSPVLDVNREETGPGRSSTPDSTSPFGESSPAVWWRSLDWFERPEVRVWFPVLGRVVVVGLALVSIAWLGRRGADQERAPVPVEPVDSRSPAPAAGNRAVAESTGSETATPRPETPCPEKEERPSGLTEDGRVILNEASAEELTQLKGVGEKRAQAIVELRERLDGFRKVSDLLRVRGIGWKSLQKLKEQVVVDRPPPPPEEQGPQDAEASATASAAP